MAAFRRTVQKYAGLSPRERGFILFLAAACIVGTVLTMVSRDDPAGADPPRYDYSGYDRGIGNAELPQGTGVLLDSLQAALLNAMTAKDLMEISGIGPVLAGNILTYRASDGDFKYAGDLQKVSGIGPKRAEAILKFLENRVKKSGKQR